MKLIFRMHALQRMYERDIFEKDIRSVIETGEVIEDYKNDLPYPSKLIFGRVGFRPLHVVASFNDEANEIIIITTYEPDPHLWESNFKKRRF